MYDVLNWQKLARLGENAPILPNLTQLTLTTPSPIKSRDQLFWIRTFLAPSLVDIRIVKPTSNKLSLLKLPMALNLLRYISSTVPDLQKLSIFIPEIQYDDKDSQMICFWEPSLSSYLGTFTSLKELASTNIVLQPDVLPTIASLRKLEVLDIQGDREPSSDGVHQYIDQKTLPLNPFPKLTSFFWRGTDGNGCIILFECRAFQNLSLLHLYFDGPPDLPEDLMDIWQCALFDVIAKACPKLSDLRIDFTELYNLRKSPKDTKSAILSMSKLPLDTVYLSWADFGDGFNLLDSFDLKSIWPLVTKLSLPHLQTNFMGLYKLSRLPKLEYLVACLYFEGDYYDDFYNAQPLGTSPLRQLNGSNYRMYYSEVAARDAAETLLKFWPNIERIYRDMSNIPEGTLDDDEDPQELIDDLEEINGEIERLRRKKDGRMDDV
ncbi:hypothetical protein RhiJN_11230 [Ceratobasidium sp. AG-Ba]|nr:hypothetical protein RhiJN_11230 [Ceratobasidium sp. AG-Ba]